MNTKIRKLICHLFIFFTTFPLFGQNAMNTYKTGEEAIASACVSAANINRNVLLKFSADWCPWCVDMKKIFQEKKLAETLSNFELVELDVGKRIMENGKKRYERYFDLMQKYSSKAFIPQLVVLDSKGNVLANLNPDDYENEKEKGNDSGKLTKILEKYVMPQAKAIGGMKNDG
ncbi:MAG: thioredoxin family protein [Candidatus Riflebacteria bacterium]|nr:thioredoxin family protein [Candidatus Riflebacteria bacterium]